MSKRTREELTSAIIKWVSDLKVEDLRSDKEEWTGLHLNSEENKVEETYRITIEILNYKKENN